MNKTELLAIMAAIIRAGEWACPSMGTIDNKRTVEEAKFLLHHVELAIKEQEVAK